MIRFNQLDLFSSGPTVLHMQSPKLRHDETPRPHDDGSTIISFGQDARTLKQTGSLLADSPTALRTLIQAIENCMDGTAHRLADDAQSLEVDAVLLEVNVIPFVAVGSRWKTEYQLIYRQLSPKAES